MVIQEGLDIVFVVLLHTSSWQHLSQVDSYSFIHVSSSSSCHLKVELLHQDLSFVLSYFGCFACQGWLRGPVIFHSERRNSTACLSLEETTYFCFCSFKASCKAWSKPTLEFPTPKHMRMPDKRVSHETAWQMHFSATEISNAESSVRQRFDESKTDGSRRGSPVIRPNCTFACLGPWDESRRSTAGYWIPGSFLLDISLSITTSQLVQDTTGPRLTIWLFCTVCSIRFVSCRAHVFEEVYPEFQVVLIG